MSSVFDSLAPERPEKNPLVKEMLRERKKLYKQLMKEKRAKLIVRNLPFSTTENNLLEYYQKFGDVVNVELLRRPNGDLVGCAFVQFKLVQNAAKARHHTNGKEFIGRTIECDFALSKDKYEGKLLTEDEIKEEPIKTEKEIKQEQIEVKDEPVDDYECKNAAEPVEIKVEDIKSEDESDESDEEGEEEEDVPTAEAAPEEPTNEETQLDDNDQSNEEEEEKMQLDEESDEEMQTDEESSEEEIKESPPVHSEKSETDSVSSVSKKPHVISNDVAEGKTVFIKNVPFDATNDDLRQCMSQYGPLYYALICIDKLTEHSKGTAFVKFKNVEDAEKCLQAGTELTLKGNVLDCHKALNKNELEMKRNAQKVVKQKDTRNLYLVKEGVVLAGTKAAEGVSATDMAKRLQLEQYKTQILRNLNMFISRTRLIVHNLPPSWDDAKLRALFKRHTDPDAVIREARVMRNMRDVDSKGIGKSKEFGFVSFTQHEHALKALRALNNNPNIFTPHKRPIVAFSIENKSMIKAKQKRLLNSKLKNPTSKMFDSNLTETHRESTEEPEIEPKAFSGTAAKRGVIKMRNRHNLKTQAKLHHEHIKKQKKKLKFEKKKTLEQKKQDFIRQPRQKINKNPKAKIDDNFSKLVSSYKKKLLSAGTAKKNKWYDG